MLPTAKKIRDTFSYDPETGYMAWKNCRKKSFNGKRTGIGVGSHGYCQVIVDGQVLLLHRVAWVYMTGKWPEHSIDHVNGIRTDNRFENLREATPAEQLANTKIRKDNRTGFKGVSWSNSSKAWRARIQQNGKGKQIGVYATREEAHAAYSLAAIKVFGDYARIN